MEKYSLNLQVPLHQQVIFYYYHYLELNLLTTLKPEKKKFDEHIPFNVFKLLIYFSNVSTIIIYKTNIDFPVFVLQGSIILTK